MATKTPSKKSKKVSRKQPKGLRAWFVAPGVREPSTLNDVKNAVLLVSLLINLGVFIFWLVLKLTTVYDQQVFDFLFSR